MRAFLEGIVVYGGMSVAGVVLLLVRNPEPLWLCVAGGVASLLYLVANWRARRAYLATLIEQLRSGRLDVEDVGDAIGGWEASRLAALWEHAMREEGLRPSTALLQLVPGLAARGVIDPLVRAASHPNADVRRSCVNALASLGGDAVVGPLGLALDDPDAGVRLAALRGLARLEGDPAFVAARLGDLLQDLDPRVRAEAALRAGPDGLEILQKMIASARNEDAVAALAVAPRSLLSAVAERARAAEPEVRAAALECLARICLEPPLESAELVALLRDADPRVRRAAALLLANFEDEEALAALAGCLTDPAPEVQFAAETVLGSLGADGLAAVEPYLSSEVERAVESALRVVAASGVSEARSVLLHELRRRVRELWYDIVVYQHLPRERTLAARFLRAAYRDAMMRERRLSFKVLEVLENPKVIRKVDRAMRAGSKRSRADALEVLSNLGDREASELLVLVHETAPLEERARALAGIVQVPETLPDILAQARRSELRWIRMAAEAVDPQEGAPPPEEDVMERLLALKRVDLFHNLSLEQLDAVHRVTKEEDYLAGEVICREGDPGDMLYLLLQGRVAVVKSHGTPEAIQLASMEAIDYFGEMAILDNEPRSATVVAQTPARLLMLDGSSLKDLILQMPDISFEIFRVLTGRIRVAEKRLSRT
jgi:HEAT repeat protein